MLTARGFEAPLNRPNYSPRPKTARQSLDTRRCILDPPQAEVLDTAALAWTAEDVYHWLRALERAPLPRVTMPSLLPDKTPRRWGLTICERDLAQYAGRFLKNGIDGAALQGLTHEQLQHGMAIKSLGHRKRLLQAIQDLFVATPQQQGGFPNRSNSAEDFQPRLKTFNEKYDPTMGAPATPGLAPYVAWAKQQGGNDLDTPLHRCPMYNVKSQNSRKPNLGEAGSPGCYGFRFPQGSSPTRTPGQKFDNNDRACHPYVAGDKWGNHAREYASPPVPWGAKRPAGTPSCPGTSPVGIPYIGGSSDKWSSYPYSPRGTRAQRDVGNGTGKGSLADINYAGFPGGDTGLFGAVAPPAHTLHLTGSYHGFAPMAGTLTMGMLG